MYIEVYKFVEVWCFSQQTSNCVVIIFGILFFVL